MPIASDIQKPDVGEFITLFDLDTTMLGGGVYHFVQAILTQNEVARWRGNAYTPIDIEAEGFEVSGQGTLPTPKLRISNVNKAMSAAIIGFGDLLGSHVTRWRTLKKYFDNGSTPDPNAHFPTDLYVVQRKSAHNKHLIEWELSSVLDYEGQKLPRRQILRDTCTHFYRYWTGTGFSYAKATCPYSGVNYWNAKGESTTGAFDRCGRRLSDCKLRFPDGPLPTSAFPGVSRTRIY